MAAAEIAIVGGGPAGLMAADVLATAGHAVSIYERHRSVGRKFLLAGRSGLNLTHSEPHDQLLARYIGASPPMLEALTRFDAPAVRSWAAGLGIETFVGSSGRVFPDGMRAAPLLRAWIRHLDVLGVKWHPAHDFVGWTDDGRLRFDTALGVVQPASDVSVLALGGASWPRVSSAGEWAAIFEADGVEIAPLRAANAGLIVDWSDVFRSRFEGEPVKNVVITLGPRAVRGEIVVTKGGLEGGPVYALASSLGPGESLTLDLAPDLDLAALRARLDRGRPKDSQSTRLRKAGLPAVAVGLLREATGNNIPDDVHELASTLKCLKLPVRGVASIDRAISTAGGVSMGELDENFMVRARPGVFAAGEMLAWDAPTGGYLLHGCLASGRAAGEGALQYITV